METSMYYYQVRRLKDRRVIKKFEGFIDALHFVNDRMNNEKLKEKDRMPLYIETHYIDRRFFYPV